MNQKKELLGQRQRQFRKNKRRKLSIANNRCASLLRRGRTYPESFDLPECAKDGPEQSPDKNKSETLVSPV